MAALVYVLKKKAKQSFWLYVKGCSFVSNTWKACPIKLNLTHLNVNFFVIVVNCIVWQNVISENSLVL